MTTRRRQLSGAERREFFDDLAVRERTRTVSESGTLIAIREELTLAQSHILTGPASGREPVRYVQNAIGLVDRLLSQVGRGVHANPPLVIYGNPPIRGGGRQSGRFAADWTKLMSDDVHQMRYTHRDDGKDYVHDFEGGVELFAIRRGDRQDILLTHSNGMPLWEDF